ncbi:dihydrofolate reductase family protein [Haladaptatus salinisoli]|uniref:dihydrofolate reductase family protein n=1 Tax=Haladaptatus salinisoli TaxID=2884876 RepID=UPI001D0A7F3C|nr:dihydrofolate reductase family protein [Haladaptatus salinisoli]
MSKTETTEKSTREQTNGRKLVVENKVTLDGIFDKQAEWQMQFWEDPNELIRYSKGHNTQFDALLLGRVTYQGLAAVWPSMTDDVGYADWINSVPKHVASTSLDTDEMEWNARLITGNVTDKVAALKRQPGRDILMVGSGELLETLMQQDLVDEYRLMIHPVVQGSGKRLFEDANESTTMNLVDTETIGSGVVVLTYEPSKEEEDK